MATCSEVALDRLIESGAAKSMAGEKAPNSELEGRNSVPNLEPERRNGGLVGTNTDKKHHCSRLSPPHYATPKATLDPDYSSSYPPSPYIVNHKRRGACLLRSPSEHEEKAVENEKFAEMDVVVPTKGDSFAANFPIRIADKHASGTCDGETGSSSHLANDLMEQNGSVKSVAFSFGREGEVSEDFFDPQESMSVQGNSEGDNDSNVVFSYLNTTTASYFDAWEELSSGSCPQPPMRDFEAEQREMRITMLMEIEKRKQAEETACNLQNQWLRICQQLSLQGLKLPEDLMALNQHKKLEVDIAEDLCQQVYLARCVSNSVGRGTSKAELEMEMDAQIELKNIEIARLSDRVQRFEAANKQMSLRNQEAVETARCLRQIRKTRQRWIWCSIAAAITLGSGALMWSYLPSGKGSYITERDRAA